MKSLVVRVSVVVMIALLALGVTGCKAKSVQGEPLAQSSPDFAVTAVATVTESGATTKVAPFATAEAAEPTEEAAEPTMEAAEPLKATETVAPAQSVVAEVIDFTLQTAVTQGKMVYIGVGGAIDGLVNPDLEVTAGATVQVTLTNGDGMQHDVSFPDFGATSELVRGRGDSTAITFEVGDDQVGVFAYYCTVPGHRQAGQEGRLIVSES